MWKTLSAGLCTFLLSTILAGTADAQLTSLTEGFDTVGSCGASCDWYLRPDDARGKRE